MDKQTLQQTTCQGEAWLLGEDEYFDFQAYSFSALKEIVPPKTPFHYWLNLRSKRKPTPAMIEGTLTHLAILEPEKFEKTCFFFDHSYSTLASGEGYQALKSFRQQHPDKTIIYDRKLWYSLQRRRKNVWKNQQIRKLLTHQDAIMEQGMTWIDPETGVRIKGKPDHFIPTVMADVKTTQNISEQKLAWEIAERLYFMQAAIYVDGVYQLTGHEIRDYFIIAVEKSSDLVRLVEISPVDIEIGRKLYRQAIIKAEDCELSQNYHGYPDSPVPIELSPYLMDKFEQLDF